jgi:hypothetical protein
VPSLNPQILGQAEHAHRALLERHLAGTGLTHQQWVALTLVRASVASAERDIFDRLGSALKIDERAARSLMTDLVMAHYVEYGGGRLQLTEAGAKRHADIKARIDETIHELYDRIPSADLVVAGRVLVQLTSLANAILAEVM